MPSYAITGNLGSGKSAILNMITESLHSSRRNTVRYSADDSNRRLLEQDAAVARLIGEKMGKDLLDEDGIPDRRRLFERITADQEAKELLESIMHPRLEAEWKPPAGRCRGNGDAFFVAELPLLFEKNLEPFFDESILIACSEQTRAHRMASSRGMSGADSARWISIQNSQEAKIAKATRVLWNDGTWESLRRQADHLLSIIFSR